MFNVRLKAQHFAALSLFLAARFASAVELPSQLDELDAYLAAAEQGISHLVPGAEKTIHWASADKTRTPVSFVYLHGYSASRQEAHPLTDVVAEAHSANVYYARLTGHGRDGQAMALATTAAWKRDVTEAYRIGAMLGEKVVVVSLSTGGTLATWLAAQSFADQLNAVVLISPNFAVHSPVLGALNLPVIGPALLSLFGDMERGWTPRNEGHAEFWTERYPIRSVQPLAQIMTEVEHIDKAAITVPALMIYSAADSVIDPAEVQGVYSSWGGSQNRIVQVNHVDGESDHVVAGDILSPSRTELVAEHILDFLTSLGVSGQATATVD